MYSNILLGVSDGQLIFIINTNVETSLTYYSISDNIKDIELHKSTKAQLNSK